MVGAKPRNGEQRNKLASPERLACCVDYTGKISNLLEDTKMIEGFSQHIENQTGE